MRTRKSTPKRTDSSTSGRFAQPRERRLHNKKQSVDVRMRSPSPRSRRNSISVADNDLTLINLNVDDHNDDEWIDEKPVSDDNNALFHWEEEATLFSDLLEEATSEDGDAVMIALAESLQKPFDEESRQLKKEIAKAFVPLVNKIKSVFATIDRTVDISSSAGVLALNDTCREVEKSISKRHESVQKTQAELKVQIDKLLDELEEEYARRDQLWVDFENAINELVNPTLEMLNEAPAKMERTIASIEKQSRLLEKEGANVAAIATEMTLKDLLSKLK